MLVAGLSRRPAEFYIEAASAARMMSERDWEETGGGDEEFPGGAIPSELNQFVAASAAHLVSSAWHPYRTRLFAWLRRRKLEAEKKAIAQELADEPRSSLDWNRVWIPQ
ncbi:MAG TPA: hypothetical protein VF179_05305 [Thermoanaerobaculia bacterium]|nr:hypothetical protein [Thermoanaerobaculia bacterium]